MGVLLVSSREKSSREKCKISFISASPPLPPKILRACFSSYTKFTKIQINRHKGVAVKPSSFSSKLWLTYKAI